jgi:hypothetical protein
MFSRKGIIIPIVATLIMIIITIIFALMGKFFPAKYDVNLVQKGGTAISLSNYAEFWRKPLDESLEIITKRAVYDLGKIGGINGNEIATWSKDYPRFSTLRNELENKIKENLPNKDIKNSRSITWGESYIITAFPGTESTLIADFNKDGVVDSDDFEIFSATYGSNCDDATCPIGGSCWGDYSGCVYMIIPKKWNPDCDFNKDGFIILSDFFTFGQNWDKFSLLISKNFLVVGNKSFSIYDKSIDSKISVIHKINYTVNSSYFKLLYVGRQIFENSKYYTNLDISDPAKLAQLKTDLEADFGITASITVIGDHIDVLLEDKSCDLINDFYCIAPLRPGETGIVVSGREIPYDYLKLHFITTG